ncbi:exodeoxyribonuclease VII large subunit, partial [Leptospira borgpetersenii serovar Hardjo-bovis]|nr:exodeoxyribonuclease VII large subunit [Leptospira borgpetersenii serovar Hardjo-bovis]
ISGEISNFTQPASGHWYFTLKDDTAQVRCAMFRNSNRRVTFRPQHGQQVLVRANMTNCGALRIDHVMSLLRLWWIPYGETADKGAYVQYPVGDLLAMIALEGERR